MQTSESIVPEGSTLVLLEEFSFSHQAAKQITAEVPDVTLRHESDIDGVWERVESGEAYGLVPFENSAAGVVWRHLKLLREGNIRIVGAVLQNIDPRVGGIKDADLEHPQVIYSHPTATGQSSQYVSKTGASIIETATTVGAAKAVRDLKNTNAVAIASAEALEHHDLTVGPSVGDLPPGENLTQFYVVKKNGGREGADSEREFHAMVITLDDRPGILRDVLKVIKDARANLISLHSHRDSDGRFSFFLEMERDGEPEEFARIEKELVGYGLVRPDDLIWLGSWDNTLTSQSMRPDVFPRTEFPVVEGAELDLRRNYHRIILEPNNVIGVLHSILDTIAIAGGNLLSFRSINRGHKRYAFEIILDTSRTTRERAELLLSNLKTNRILRKIEWGGSFEGELELS